MCIHMWCNDVWSGAERARETTERACVMVAGSVKNRKEKEEAEAVHLMNPYRKLRTGNKHHGSRPRVPRTEDMAKG